MAQGNLLQKAAEAQQRAQSLRLQPAQGQPAQGQPAQGQPAQGQPAMDPGMSAGMPPGMPPPGANPNAGAALPPDPSGPAQSGVPPGAMPGEAAPSPPSAPPPEAEAEAAAANEGPGFQGEQASAVEQREYERALAGLYKVLYEDDRTHQAVLRGLKSTPFNKVEPITKTSLLLIQQLDEKVDLDEAVVAQITGDTVDRLIEMAEVRYKAEYSDLDAQRALGATWEGVMMMFGVDEQDFKQTMAGMRREDIVRGSQVYEGAKKRPSEPGAPQTQGPPAGGPPPGMPPAGPGPMGGMGNG